MLVACDARAPATAVSPPPARGDEVVVARVDGSPIYLSDLARLAVGEGLVESPEDFTPATEGYAAMLEEATDQRILANSARAQGLDGSEEALRRLATLEERMLGNLLVERHLEDVVTERALRQLYAEQEELRPDLEQVKAAHILVSSREAAEAAAARVERGEDFGDVAAEVSLAPTASAGGELPWLSRELALDEYGAAFRDAAFATGPGNLSPPVETDAGVHIIRVEEVREDAPPTFIQLEDSLRDFLTYDTLEAFMEAQREAADVEVLEPGEDAQGAREGAQE